MCFVSRCGIWHHIELLRVWNHLKRYSENQAWQNPTTLFVLHQSRNLNADLGLSYRSAELLNDEAEISFLFDSSCQVCCDQMHHFWRFRTRCPLWLAQFRGREILPTSSQSETHGLRCALVWWCWRYVLHRCLVWVLIRTLMFCWILLLNTMNWMAIDRCVDLKITNVFECNAIKQIHTQNIYIYISYIIHITCL